MNDRDFLQRLEIGYQVYKEKMGKDCEQIQIDLFISWLYNQYGIVRKGVTNDKLDIVQTLGTQSLD